VADFYTVVNNYSTTLATAYTSGSSLVLASGGGAALIAKLTAEGQSPPSAMLPLRVTVDDGTNQTVFKVTGRSGDTLTVLHLDGESALPGGGYAAGSTVECRWTSGAVRETQTAINDHLVDTANPHATTYTQVGAAAASHSHAASDITSGTLATSRGGTGLGSIGTANQVAGVNAAASGLEYKTITAGSGITVTHAANSVTIASSGGGGTPGGSSGTIQYNNAGAFGGFGSWNGTVLAIPAGARITFGTGYPEGQFAALGNDYFIHNAGGRENTFVGAVAGNLSITGTGNTAFGHNALNALTTGARNTAVGAYAALYGATISDVTAVGWAAMAAVTTASGATAVGRSVFNNATTVTRSAGTGSTLCTTATSAVDIVAMGSGCGVTATAPDNSVMLGSNVFSDATTLTGSVGLGKNAANTATSVTESVVLGDQAGGYTATLNRCVLIGTNAGRNSPSASGTLTDAVAIGSYAQPPASNTFVMGGTGGQAVVLMFGSRAFPSDSAISTSQMCMRFENTDGAAKIQFRGKNASGTIVTGELALS
jgi:hypothetical protein